MSPYGIVVDCILERLCIQALDPNTSYEVYVFCFDIFIKVKYDAHYCLIIS